MDLAIIQGLLNDFATFGKNIGTALQNIPTLIGSIVDFFTNFNETADNTDAAFDSLSSADADADADAGAGSSFEGSSDAEAEAGSSFEGSSESETEAGSSTETE